MFSKQNSFSSISRSLSNLSFQWQDPSATDKVLFGRIIRLNVSCTKANPVSSFTRCILLKAIGSVTCEYIILRIKSSMLLKTSYNLFIISHGHISLKSESSSDSVKISTVIIVSYCRFLSLFYFNNLYLSRNLLSSSNVLSVITN